MRADLIGSLGRTGQVTASTIGSLGRIGGFLGEIIEVIKREIFEAYSRITKSIELDSRIDT